MSGANRTPRKQLEKDAVAIIEKVFRRQRWGAALKEELTDALELVAAGRPVASAKSGGA